MELIRRFSSVPLCAAIMISVAYGVLVVKPQNDAVYIGQEVIMLCKTSGSAKLWWDGYGPESPMEDRIPISSGDRCSSYAAKFCKPSSGVDGDHSLLITASREAALIYKCTEPGSLESWSAQLIALKSNLTCNKTSTCDVDHVIITCVIDFYGHWAPAIEWRRCDGNDETITMTEVENSISPSERVTSTFTKNISHNDFCFKVTACFKEEGRPMVTDADNIPSYNYTTYVTQHCSMDNDYNNNLPTIAMIATATILIGVALAVILWCYRKKLDGHKQNFLRHLSDVRVKFHRTRCEDPCLKISVEANAGSADLP